MLSSERLRQAIPVAIGLVLLMARGWQLSTGFPQVIRPIDGDPSERRHTVNPRFRALAQAITVAVPFFFIAGAVEASLIRIIQPTELELDWVSDVVLSAALGSAVYFWLHLRATRLALAERERAQL